MAYRYKKIKLRDGSTRDEHRLVMEEYLGRKLDFEEFCHHCNGDTKDNRIENLELMLRPEHARIHFNKDLSIIGLEAWTKKVLERTPAGFAFCQKCRQLLPLDRFYADAKRITGVRKLCKECNKLRNRLYKERKRRERREHEIGV